MTDHFPGLPCRRLTSLTTPLGDCPRCNAAQGEDACVTRPPPDLQGIIDAAETMEMLKPREKRLTPAQIYQGATE